MSATPILPHQFAASILLFYAFLAVCFSAKRLSKSVKLTHLDIDLEYCTVDDLEYMTVLLLTQAQTTVLNEQETRRFAAVSRELEDRKHGKSVVSISSK
jgi:hypothetical protein